MPVSKRGFAVSYGSTAETKEEANTEALDQLHYDLGSETDYDVIDVKVSGDGPYTVELDTVVTDTWNDNTPADSELFSTAETFEEFAVEEVAE